jgi:hypothetical protein
MPKLQQQNAQQTRETKRKLQQQNALQTKEAKQIRYISTSQELKVAKKLKPYEYIKRSSFILKVWGKQKKLSGKAQRKKSQKFLSREF